MPRAERVIRDFLIGNLSLFATCSWDGLKRAGRIRLRPENVLFFDAQKKPISATRSLIMQCVLWGQGIKIQNVDGFGIYFWEEKQ